MQELIYLCVHSQDKGFNTQTTMSQEWDKYCEVALKSLEKLMALYSTHLPMQET